MVEAESTFWVTAGSAAALGKHSILYCHATKQLDKLWWSDCLDISWCHPGCYYHWCNCR